MKNDKRHRPPSPLPSPRKEQIGFRMYPPLLEALDCYAQEEDITRNAAVEHLLTWALTEAGHKPEG